MLWGENRISDFQETFLTEFLETDDSGAQGIGREILPLVIISSAFSRVAKRRLSNIKSLTLWRRVTHYCVVFKISVISEVFASEYIESLYL